MRKEKLSVTKGPHGRQAGGRLVKARWRMAVHCRPEGKALLCTRNPLQSFDKRLTESEVGQQFCGSTAGGGFHRETL